LAIVQRAAIGIDILEPIVLALLLGVAIRAAIGPLGRLGPGAAYASITILEWSIVLLGASVQLQSILAPGLVLPAFILTVVTASLVVSYAIGRRLGLSRNLALLVAVGNSICGNSAIIAVAPIIKAERHEVASSIALTAVLGVTLVLTLPVAMMVIGLNQYQYGVLAGMSVYSVPQVVAATLGVGQVAGAVAAVVKLTRVLLLGPLVVTIAVLTGHRDSVRGGGTTIWRYIPWFVVGFLLFGGLRSVGIIPEPLADASRELARWATVLAMAGLGLGVELAVVRSVGPRVAAAVVLSLTFMIGASLAGIVILGLP